MEERQLGGRSRAITKSKKSTGNHRPRRTRGSCAWWIPQDKEPHIILRLIKQRVR